MGYVRIEAERAGRHLPRPYGERDTGLRMTRVCRTRGLNRPHAKGGQRRAKPPMPKPQKSGGYNPPEIDEERTRGGRDVAAFYARWHRAEGT